MISRDEFWRLFRFGLVGGGATLIDLGTAALLLWLAPLLMDVRDPEQMESTLRYLLQYRMAGVIFTSGSPPIELAREYLRLQVPVAKVMFHCGLLPGVLQGESEFLVIGGVSSVVLSTF